MTGQEELRGGVAIRAAGTSVETFSGVFRSLASRCHGKRGPRERRMPRLSRPGSHPSLVSRPRDDGPITTRLSCPLFPHPHTFRPGIFLIFTISHTIVPCEYTNVDIFSLPPPANKIGKIYNNYYPFNNIIIIIVIYYLCISGFALPRGLINLHRVLLLLLFFKKPAFLCFKCFI